VNKGGKLLEGSARVLILTQSVEIKDRGEKIRGEKEKDKRKEEKY
jgi:hypothetical protein